jgi:GTP cyclohydrolase I
MHSIVLRASHICMEMRNILENMIIFTSHIVILCVLPDFFSLNAK